VALPSGTLELGCPLVGEHNLENVLVVLGIGVALGADDRRLVEALGRVSAAPGRLERCDTPEDDVVVLVDYAHTPDALRRLLEAARPLTSGRLVCVFGCGGDRDPDKRPKMGRAVAQGADWAMVTNDNPRTEEPASIASAIERGLAGARYEVQLDRACAIRSAILGASPGDLVVVAGKGHETYQIVGRERRHFDDREQARAALLERRRRGEGVGG
jgi:UDP-N-acetylmuramoyl-L-alanyl-D-glutamate--2,6-diaminopimelate ligase